MIVRSLSIVIATTLVLAGCASPHRCPMEEEMGITGCHSMEETYDAASGDDGGDLSVWQRGGNGKDNEDRDEDEDELVPEKIAQATTPIHPFERKPVWTPARVYRALIAPWKTGEGENAIMHGGELVYFTVPGRWSYGTLDAPGSVNAVSGPLEPDDLGFDPKKSAPAPDFIEPDFIMKSLR